MQADSLETIIKPIEDQIAYLQKLCDDWPTDEMKEHVEPLLIKARAELENARREINPPALKEGAAILAFPHGEGK